MSTQVREFTVNRADLSQAKWISSKAEVEDGQILTKIEKFAFTANNITYAVAGDMLNYWSFFPAEDGWGKIPVWGFAQVMKSRSENIAEGERLYGYFPMSTHLVMQPEKVTTDGFLDLYKQRRELHPVYNSYTRSKSTTQPHDDLQPILRPLYTTSFLIDDWLADNAFFGATQALILSASSKTGLGLAFGLSRRRPQGPEVVGVTSPGNMSFVKGLGYYDRVIDYDAISSLDANLPTLVVDFAGNGDVLAAVHNHFGANLLESTQVGLSHWDAGRPSGALPGAKPRFFFAPDQVRKRTGDWGKEGFDWKLGENWNAFAIDAGDWLTVRRSVGEDEIARVYTGTRAGHINPADGHILAFE